MLKSLIQKRIEVKDKPVIMVVDDHIQNIELLEAYLVPQGYEIVKAANGDEALEKLSSNQIDLILLDIMMPGMDGFEVTRRVRQDDKIRLVPIILVTALLETEDRVKGIEAGCDDFISKPFDRHELLVRVRSLLKVKAYNDLMSNYRKELESEVTRSTDELTHALENLRQEITERKRAEIELRAANQQMAASNQQLRATEQQLRASNQQLRATEQQLRASNQQLEAGMEMLAQAQAIARLGSWEWDAKNDVINGSKEFYRLFGVGHDQMRTYQAFIDRLHPDDIEHVGRNVQESLTKKALYDTEYRVRMPDGDYWLFSFDAPVALNTSGGPVIFVPGDVVLFTGSLFSSTPWYHDPGFPQTGALADFFFFDPSFPAAVPDGSAASTPLTIGKSASPGYLDLSWGASCGIGVTNYIVYEGTIGSWYSHDTNFGCSNGTATSQTILPSGGNTYYLVVPATADVEGSYGKKSDGTERPPAAVSCIGAQDLTACP